MGKKQKLFDLLYEWTIEENCDYCKHLKSFRDGDNRHPCNRCADYELFKLDDALKKELVDCNNKIVDNHNAFVEYLKMGKEEQPWKE